MNESSHMGALRRLHFAHGMNGQRKSKPRLRLLLLLLLLLVARLPRYPPSHPHQAQQLPCHQNKNSKATNHSLALCSRPLPSPCTPPPPSPLRPTQTWILKIQISVCGANCTSVKIRLLLLPLPSCNMYYICTYAYVCVNLYIHIKMYTQSAPWVFFTDSWEQRVAVVEILKSQRSIHCAQAIQQ